MIKRLREERGLTPEELAKRAGVTKPYVSMIEGGERKSPSLPILKRLAKALGVPVTARLDQAERRLRHAKQTVVESKAVLRRLRQSSRQN